MLWSRYNTLFHSKRFGYFLYNALSNTLLEIDQARYRSLEKARDCGLGSEHLENQFFSLLRKHKMLVTDGEENRLLLARQARRHTLGFDASRLGLTLCPTLQCNFRCPYCFERSQQNAAIMTPETIGRLLAFIKSHREVHHLALAWYGGEPLLCFRVIRDITERIKSLNLDFEGAALVTNGYLLDRKKCDQLNALKILSVQITLDGPEEIHNQRRFLAGGGPTFQQILANLDTLMDSTYEGSCAIRINIDKHNIAGYAALHASLRERFKGKQFSIYAGHVHTSLEHSYKHSRCLDLQEWTDFNFEMYRRGGLMATGDFYPADIVDSVCVGTAPNRFVVGPKGELYKCWEDVGKPTMVIGSIHQAEPVTNPDLCAQYCTGTDPYSDPDCLACSVLPICGGGCPNKRLRAKQLGEHGLEFCSPYKEHLIDYLEAYIDTFLNREICTAVLNPVPPKPDRDGYRIISPAKKPAGVLFPQSTDRC